MVIVSALTTRLGITHPLLLAPMANVAGGRLAGAVSRAGGLGLIGAGYGDPQWLVAELAAADGAEVGVGFINWRLDEAPELLDLALAARPPAVLLSFGGIAPYVRRFHAAGAVVIAQVQSVHQARAAGHAGMRGTLALVPAVVDAVGAVPVVAARGIGDARGVADAFMLGACGVMLGSRFYASREALIRPNAQQAVLQASGDDTVRGAVFDRLRGWAWPDVYSLRTLNNDMTARWPAQAKGLQHCLAAEQAVFETALVNGDTRLAPVIIGEAVDLLHDLPPAADILSRLMAQAEALLLTVGQRLSVLPT